MTADGFTLRAALDLLPSSATVVVSEVIPSGRRMESRRAGPLAARASTRRRSLSTTGAG